MTISIKKTETFSSYFGSGPIPSSTIGWVMDFLFPIKKQVFPFSLYAHLCIPCIGTIILASMIS